MAPTPDELSAPGSATYASDTMTVGDGTWVFSKNTFLLPNLQGVNFDTMRYNGMTNEAPTARYSGSRLTVRRYGKSIFDLYWLS